jgi:hypothetical protein
VPAAITGILSRLQELVTIGGLKATDLLAAFIHRRVCPLQIRPHRICDMIGRRDPCRLSTKRLPSKEVVRHVNDISKSKLDEDGWEFGMPPYCRRQPPPPVSTWSPYFAHAVLLLRAYHLSTEQLMPGQVETGAPAPGQDWAADRAESDLGDPELGAAFDEGEEEEVTGGGDAGGGGGAGGSGGAGGGEDVDLRDWRDDDDDDEVPHRRAGPGGAEAVFIAPLAVRPPSGAPAGAAGRLKRRADPPAGGQPSKRNKPGPSATKRQEALKAAALRKGPKAIPLVSG